MIAQIIYASKPVPAHKTRTAHIRRTIVGSMPKYFAKPAHTPHIILSFDFVSIFIMMLLYSMLMSISPAIRDMTNLFCAFSLSGIEVLPFIFKFPAVFVTSKL